MNFSSETPRVKKLNFRPQTDWPPAFPTLLWRGIVIAESEKNSGSDATHYGVYEVDPTYPIEKLLAETFPQLQWLEILLLTKNLIEVKAPFDAEVLWRQYNFRQPADQDQYFTMLRSLPQEFVQWLITKDFGWRDLAALKVLMNNPLGELPLHQDLFRQLLMWPVSKSDAQKLLEWWADLAMLGNTRLAEVFVEATKIREPQKASELFLRQLEALRYPIATEKIKKSQDLITKLPWPSKLQARVTRRADQMGVEVKFFAQNRQELVKQVEGLQLVIKKMTEENIERI